MKRPYVICHMAPSIDGRIVTKRWPNMKAVSAAYEETAKTLDGDAWIIGRVSMDPYAGKARIPRSSRRIPKKDYIAPHTAKSFAIAIDPSGKLRWESNNIDGEHVITVLTSKVSSAYLAYLRKLGISYLIGIDLKKTLEKLREYFGIERLLLEGGGIINGSFLKAGLIDELSILIAPVADGIMNTATLFDGNSGPARTLRLISAEARDKDIAWLRYRVKQ
jgi:2,5-diamino-6-(ribosylamino)-4(3H)-pyrimidinone 5'-phosphate reductase